METKQEQCGCEFTTLISEDGQNSFTTLTKCRCQKHQSEQFIAFLDGEQLEDYEPTNPLPLEVA